MTYIYKCQCGHIFETSHPMSFDGPVCCPECDSDETTKVPTCPAIVFGWKQLPFEEGALAAAKNRFRPSAVPQSVAVGG